MWTAVGSYLISLTIDWIFAPNVKSPWNFWLPGIGLAYLIFRFGFSRLARKNSLRINNLDVEKPCLFAFQEWHSYPLIAVMIGLGITLRNYAPIPKPLLGIMYIGIGGGLGLSSFRYYWQIFHNKRPPSVS
ncbi:MAG: hypothetical protein DRJ13_08740 [Bacteroidetes bacterium]|nr:MAG: hypothetical protein DRJ13_08740 [Bacteroidota bacterium]